MQSFKGYIIEMASTAQQGFQYEINAVKVLKPIVDIVMTSLKLSLVNCKEKPPSSA